MKQKLCYFSLQLYTDSQHFLVIPIVYVVIFLKHALPFTFARKSSILLWILANMMPNMIKHDHFGGKKSVKNKCPDLADRLKFKLVK